jgi:signal transduction histidine kinase
MSPEKKLSSILIVDDTVENLRVLSGMLTVRGFDVRPVTSGREALQVVAHEPPDLVLLDVMMPEMNGFEVCAKLRENQDWSEIPVIFLTALTDVADKVKGFAAGGTDYITKPFQIEEVLARVDNQLALRQARRQLSESLDRLRELERLRDDLVHMVVHDMRSPLSVLIGRLELLKPHVTGASERTLDAATRSAVGLNRMADTLLDVSRLEEGQMPLDRAVCDLVKLADDVRHAFVSMDQKRVIDLESRGAVMVACDAGLIRRVIENLVSNGIKHTPDGGRLHIEVNALPGRARISVEDEGDGVPPEARHRIFEKFGTLEARKERSYHSAGLGLAFCKLAVQAHGGAIGVDSVDPHGSLFWVELPT